MKKPSMVAGKNASSKKPAKCAAGVDKYRIHLIDALPYVFRAFYSLPSSITDSMGRPAGAVVGFGGMLIRYINEERPTHIGLCFDTELTSSFRNEVFPEYKAGRKAPPPIFAGQVDRCKEVAKALGITCYEDKKLEADDLLACLADPLVADGHECVVVTSDKDMMQLVGPNVSVYDFAKGERYDAAGVKKKMGVRPEQVTDFLGLAGDQVDNIPGVRGLGNKTAVILLAKFNSIDDIYSNLDCVASMKIRGAEGIAARLKEHRKNAFLSRQLATLKRQRVARGDLAHLRRKNPIAKFEEVLGGLGVSRLHDRIRSFPKALLPGKR